MITLWLGHSARMSGRYDSQDTAATYICSKYSLGFLSNVSGPWLKRLPRVRLIVMSPQHGVVQSVHQERHPADTPLEEAEPEGRELIEHSAEHEAGDLGHVLEGQA